MESSIDLHALIELCNAFNFNSIKNNEIDWILAYGKRRRHRTQVFTWYV